MCGIIGVFNHPQAAKIAYLGLQALQHRGQEAAGIATSRNFYHGTGLVTNVFSEEVLHRLIGDSAIGHVRYSTAGGGNAYNIQPLIHPKQNLSLAHNGNIVNANILRSLRGNGYKFSSSADTEIIFALIDGAHNKNSLEEKLLEASSRLVGAFSILALTPNKLIAMRDPHGFRPLVLGDLNGAYVVASEVCALNLIGARYINDVKPGEMISIGGTLDSYRIKSNIEKTPCIFEHVYFGRPDSRMEGVPIYGAREKMGIRLAKEHPVDADVVIPVPDSGNIAAMGYSQESGIPYAMGLIKSHYAGRTFIQPTNELRTTSVRLKFCVVNQVIRNKRVIVVDDSLVRGTTSKRIIQVLREAGAREIHMRISAPPTISTCHYGMDTPSRKELIAANYKEEEIRREIECDSLKYLSLKGLRESVGGGSWCDACFTRNYPTQIGY
jgi:amidophosphoribosyltransferase